MIDTDGILDRCQCGERGTWTQHKGVPNPYYINEWSVDCLSCGASTGRRFCQSEAMVAWNVYQRGIKNAKVTA